MHESARGCHLHLFSKYDLHERIQDQPHRHEQQPQDEQGESSSEDDVVELAGAVVLREGVKFRAEAEESDYQTRNAKAYQRPAEADKSDDVHQHLDAVGDRVLA